MRGLHSVSGVHNYGPDDLRVAVDFLTAAHRAYPFPDLVADPVGLADLETAFGDDALDEGTTRRAVIPHAT